MATRKNLKDNSHSAQLKAIARSVLVVLPVFATTLFDLFIERVPLWLQIFIATGTGFVAIYEYVLLPWERKKLDRIEALIDDQQISKARDELSSRSIYKGKRAQFRQALLWHTLYGSIGELIEEYTAAQNLAKLALSPTES